MRYNSERGRWEKTSILDWLTLDSEAFQDIAGITDLREEALSDEVAEQYTNLSDPAPIRKHLAQIRALKAYGFRQEARNAGEAVQYLADRLTPEDYDAPVYTVRHEKAPAPPAETGSTPEDRAWQRLIEEARALDRANGFGKK